MTDFNDFVVAAGTPSGTVKVPGVIDGTTATKGFNVTLAAQALLDDDNTAAQLGTLGPFNTASSAGGSSVPIDLGNKAGLILTLTGNVTTFALPTNGPSGTWQETLHTLRVVASGATRTIATGAFTSFDLGGSVAPASGYSIADGTTKDFTLRRVHNGTAAVWFVDLLIPGTDVANTPAGNIAATTVQAAINELDTEKLTSGGALGTPSSGTLTNCTGLPVAGITGSTSTALGVGSIELGHASDTTLARSAAGVATIEGVRVSTLTAVNSVNATGNLVNNTINEFYGSTASQTLTLPTMADGDSLVVDNTSSVSVTIGRNSQTINGASADDTLTAGKAVTYYWRASGALRRIGALS